jgi:exopolysaccharide production protein ExoZ
MQKYECSIDHAANSQELKLHPNNNQEFQYAGKSKIDSLQAIRGFAAIAVMLFHGSQIIHERLGYIFLNKVFAAGFCGVDIFFILTGFIILNNAKPGIENIGPFIKKRFIRIYPTYWIITAALIFMYFISPSPDQSYKSDPGVILGSFLLIPQNKYILGVAWTLPNQIIFYLVFSITYFRSQRIFFYTITGWTATILVLHFLHIKTPFFATYALIQPIFLEFTLGCLVAYIYNLFPNAKHSSWLFLVGLILLMFTWRLYCVLEESCSDHFNDIIKINNDMTRVYLFGIPAALIIFGALYLPVTMPKALVFLGDASYSIYLMHGTILSLLIKLVVKFNLISLFSNIAGIVTLFSATLFIATFFYRAVERKLLAFLNKLTTSSRIQN